MKIISKDKLNQAVNLLEEAMDLINRAIALEDEELRKENDFYAKIENIIDEIKEV
jgi:hypothetical protein